jgi:hypothetical protein
MSRLDRILGIAVGLVLGVGVVTAFVFLGAEETIDDPALSGDDGARDSEGGTQPAVAEVRITGAAPPEGGPARFDYEPGDQVRLRVASDQTVDVELIGFGVTRQVRAGRPELIELAASRSGNFPLVIAGSNIAVAEIRIEGSP